MKVFVVLSALVALASAEPPVNSYAAPQVAYQAQEPAYGVPAAIQVADGGYSGGGGYGGGGGQVFRHVYVHTAPDEPTLVENKVLRIPGGGEKHVNIIFVKAPSSSSHQNTEVILPEQPQQKTVVYVLVKKPVNSNNVKVTGPGPARQTKPEVFFIRYKNAQAVAPAYGVPVATPVYGAPQAEIAYAAPQVAQAAYGAPVAQYGAPAVVAAPVVSGGY